jgi:hypothetical protein
MNLITHNEVPIKAPAAAVWPYILELNRWKKGAVLEHLSGPVGMRGEWFAAVMPASQDALYYAMNVELVPYRRRTLKLLQGRQGPLIGFASWALRADGGVTTLTYDAYCEYSLGAAAAAASNTTDSERIEAQQIAMHSARFDEELRYLKQLVERDG